MPDGTADVSDLVEIVSPHETPLLDALGDPLWAATSMHHEWLEDELLPNKDAINHTSWSDPRTDTQFDVDHGSRFRTRRVWYGNYTQIFTIAVEVRSSAVPTGQSTLADEVDYQKQVRLRELLHALENTVINGVGPSNDPQGSGTVRRTMKGIIPHLATNVFHTGDSGFPTGNDLDETKVNYVLRNIWKNGRGNVDLIVMSISQKCKISHMYASAFGSCEIVVTRWMPDDVVLFLDSSKIEVVPRAGHSFHYKLLARSPHFQHGQLSGEYTLELRNEAAHGLIRGLKTE